MAGLDQAQGAIALTGFTLNEIIKQQQPREAGSEETAARLHVYPLFSVGGFKANDFFCSSSLSACSADESRLV